MAARAANLFVVCIACIPFVALAGTNYLDAWCNVTTSSGDPNYPIQGTIYFKQVTGTTNNISITIDLKGFNTSDLNHLHGFHVHEIGNLGNGCKNAKGHYNPMMNNHSAPTSLLRHVGDLGNIDERTSTPAGSVMVTLTDWQVKLDGVHSVMDRAVVIHAGQDDLGLGGHSDSLTTGHAGSRLACCKIVQGSGGTTGGSVRPTPASLLLTTAISMGAMLALHGWYGIMPNTGR